MTDPNNPAMALMPHQQGHQQVHIQGQAQPDQPAPTTDAAHYALMQQQYAQQVQQQQQQLQASQQQQVEFAQAQAFQHPGMNPAAQYNVQAHQVHQQQRQQLQSFWSQQMREIEGINDFKNHQLPLARIKKIMKSDEEVRMISAEAPALFAKACEMFILELTLRSWIHSEENKRRTLQRSDIAAAITKTDIFDFLVDIVPRDDLKDEGIVARPAPAGMPVTVSTPTPSAPKEPQQQTGAVTSVAGQVPVNPGYYVQGRAPEQMHQAMQQMHPALQMQHPGLHGQQIMYQMPQQGMSQQGMAGQPQPPPM